MSANEPRGGLAGLRVLVPRGGEWGDRVCDAITERGGTARLRPLIALTPPRDAAPLSLAAADWNAGAYDWLAATSANAVTAIVAAGAHPVAGGRAAALGPATAAALEQRGFLVAARPGGVFTGAGLAGALLAALDGRESASILFPASEIAGEDFERAMRAHGHTVDRVAAYRTVAVPPDPGLASEIALGEINAILVTSGSVARALASLVAVSGIHDDTLVAAIGPPSARALTEVGIRIDVTASTHTSDGLLDALSHARTRPKGTQ